ncbi:MAG: polysaccharide biosynthesis protein, partial [Bacteroidetes bacterium]|nr:polysaccharide biosynthesis protein [Bacteroidota bacterium]
MKEKIKNYFTSRFLPNGIVLFFDIVIVFIILFLTYWLRAFFEYRSFPVQSVLLQIVFGVPLFLIVALSINPHKGIIRHTTVDDAIKILLTHVIGSSGLLIFSIIGRSTSAASFLIIPYSIIIVHFFISTSFLIGYRLIIKSIYYRLTNEPMYGRNILIYGAGSMGRTTRNVIEQDINLKYNIKGFIDDNIQMQGKRIGGIQVFSNEVAFGKNVDKLKIKEIILAINEGSISVERKADIIERCLQKKIKVSDVPESKEWINGKLSTTQIKDVKIEDLLSRDAIQLDSDKIGKWLSGKTILVTGAAGSIGSEIVRQIMGLNWKRLILLDIAESPLFVLQNEILKFTVGKEVHFIVGDIRDTYRMQMVFKMHHPDIIYHASAYKHVPLMEEFPYEAIKCNVGGLKIMADLAVLYDVEKFVLVSTDKAVNPTNVMGASKRICEIYVQALAQNKDVLTKFIITRFGNVLGSSGSVIPLFKRQIEHKGPLTVTHKEIMRYFMTIPEACQLVLEAGYMGNGGEIYIFDMGEPVKIYDLAIKMIQLSGYVPHKDIAIEVTGLRPGEKLFEELLTGKEDLLPTHHKKIHISKVQFDNYNEKHQKIVQ